MQPTLYLLEGYHPNHFLIYQEAKFPRLDKGQNTFVEHTMEDEGEKFRRPERMAFGVFYLVY